MRPKPSLTRSRRWRNALSPEICQGTYFSDPLFDNLSKLQKIFTRDAARQPEGMHSDQGHQLSK